ncbi:MAG: DUF169 domain-containing protein [Candidatus Aminicenantes bacterium]|nr:DUF169 domain-containing protein [Candidatus Aminicenantes bacterium]
MRKETQPASERLRKKLDIELPLIGFYDAPDPSLFKPLVTPKENDCVFSFYKNWLKGETLHSTRENYGCGGAGSCIWRIQVRSRKEFIKFLADFEGLKVSAELMEASIDSATSYQAENAHIFIGPLKEEGWPYLKTITFLVNPDQLSALMIGAQYHSAPDDPTPVIAPFGSGCREIIPFKDFHIPQASIGATDIAMRQHLPPDLLAFTVTKPMFSRLCTLDERSFLYKPFLERLKKARSNTLFRDSA